MHGMKMIGCLDDGDGVENLMCLLFHPMKMVVGWAVRVIVATTVFVTNPIADLDAVAAVSCDEDDCDDPETSRAMYRVTNPAKYHQTRRHRRQRKSMQ